MSDWEAYLQPVKEMIARIVGLTKESSEEEWMDVIEEMDKSYNYRHYLCNHVTTEESPFPSKRWTIQHHAAYFNVPIEVVKFMVQEKHFAMSFKDGEGKFPSDYLDATVDEKYRALFMPKYGLPNLDMEKLKKIEDNFHATINSRVANLVKEHNLILPVLSVALERQFATKSERGYCGIPGMYGGFTIEFIFNENKSDLDHLITSSWCRVAGGSGETHKCTPEKYELVDKGFV